MLVVAVVGLARSGKDTVAGFFEKEGFVHFDFFRNVMIPLMEEQGIPATKENAYSFGNQMRAKFGMGVFGEKMAQLLKGHERVVVTGARSLEELKPLEQMASRFFIVRVEALDSKRFERRTELDPVDSKDFFTRDKDDIERKGLSNVLKAADFVIENNSTLLDLESRVKALMKRFK